MKDVKNATFLKDFCFTAENMYRLGWDERNGGNISMLLTNEEAEEYFEGAKPIRLIPLSFDASELKGKKFLVTGTGKYFKNVLRAPEINLGIINVSDDGKNAELLWGFEDGGKFTSEFSSHLLSHAERLKVDPNHRVVMHTHPTATLAMTHVHSLSEREFTRTLWKMMTESIVVFPDGVGVLPWMICGTNEIGTLTAEKMREFRLCVWAQHGIFGTGKDLDETFGLIETVEKAAEIYMMTSNLNKVNEISDEDLSALAKAFNVTPHAGYLNI